MGPITPHSHKHKQICTQKTNTSPLLEPTSPCPRSTTPLIDRESPKGISSPANKCQWGVKLMASRPKGLPKNNFTRRISVPLKNWLVPRSITGHESIKSRAGVLQPNLFTASLWHKSRRETKWGGASRTGDTVSVWNLKLASVSFHGMIIPQ